MQNFKLGRRAIKTDSRTLKMANYTAAGLPEPPASAGWDKGVTDFGMMKNDELGDCTIAGCAHGEQIWTVNAYPHMSTISDADVLKYYMKWCGYDPSDPSTDQGGIELDVLKNWRKEGFAGRHILGFADPNVRNLKEVRQSIAWFGGVYIGVNLPATAQDQDVWDVVSNGGHNAQPGTWGGHCVYVCAYDKDGFECITWGKLKRMTTAFWNNYVDEAHTILGCGWINNKKSPSGFDMEQLQSDLKAIR